MRSFFARVPNRLAFRPAYKPRHHYNRRHQGHPLAVASVMGKRGKLLGTGLWSRNAFLAPATRDWT